MDNKHIQALSLNDFFKIMSSNTKKLFMDREFNCYMFDNKKDAEKFCENLEDTYIEPINSIRPQIFCENLYSLGYENIKITVRKDKFIIPTVKPEFQYGLHNNELNRYLILLKQTKAKKYLKHFYKTPFFCPVYITERKIKEHPNLKYSCAKITDKGVYYILFSSIYEFEKWNSTQETDWKPFRVKIHNFNRIRKNNPIIINPHSDRIMLTNEYIKVIMEAKSNE